MRLQNYKKRLLAFPCLSVRLCETTHIKVVEKIKTHILCVCVSFFSKTHALYEIMLKTMGQRDRLQMTIWRTHSACWLPQATITCSECVILISFPWLQWLFRCTSMLFSLHHACCLVTQLLYQLMHLYKIYTLKH